MLAEGLTQLYEQLTPVAADRIKRALALGVAMKYPTMIALSAAWKAHLEFEWGDYEEMVKSLKIAEEHCDDGNLDAATRLAMVLCNAFTICGDRSSSQRWFLRAKDLASKNGDQPSTMALIYNRAAFLTTRARAENCIQELSRDLLHPIRMEFESARNFQGLTQLVAFPSHLQLWDARLQILEDKFHPAIQALNAVRTQSPFAEHNFSQAFIDLEICYCQLRSGQTDVALGTFERTKILELHQMDVDEQMVGAWLMWKLAAADARFGAQSGCLEEFEKTRRVYEGTMSGLLAQLSSFAHAK
jgi:hypothetical protein